MQMNEHNFYSTASIYCAPFKCIKYFYNFICSETPVYEASLAVKTLNLPLIFNENQREGEKE